uniref:Uncharacterized protein n=1 Tax=Oryza barthii TaxID=65489 RepID=A0A0D3GNB7_9ORYZ
MTASTFPPSPRRQEVGMRRRRREAGVQLQQEAGVRRRQWEASVELRREEGVRQQRREAGRGCFFSFSSSPSPSYGLATNTSSPAAGFLDSVSPPSDRARLLLGQRRRPPSYLLPRSMALL